MLGLRRQHHEGCFACGSQNPAGLRLECHSVGDDRVEGTFEPQPWMRGYDGRMQGGLIATLLDSAMTQCLFARGVSAVTARLEIRFCAPVSLDQPLRVTARIVECRHSIYFLRAELWSADRRLARATAQFVPLTAGN